MGPLTSHPSRRIVFEDASRGLTEHTPCLVSYRRGRCLNDNKCDRSGIDVMRGLKAKNPRPGDVVEIVFLDHAEHDATADNGDLEFTVYGRVVSADPRTITLETWCYSDPRTPFDTNVVRYTIIRGAIRKLTVLRPAARPLKSNGRSRKLNGRVYLLPRRHRRPVLSRSRN